MSVAQHYGFTDEELDFIINYDIKYRMGREEEADEPEGKRREKGDIVLFGCSVEFKGGAFHVTHGMTSERCLSPRGHKGRATD